LTIVSIIVPSVLELGKKAQAFGGGVSDTSSRLFDKVVHWKKEKRRRRSSGEIAFAQSKQTLTIGVSVYTSALPARSRAAGRV